MHKAYKRVMPLGDAASDVLQAAGRVKMKACHFIDIAFGLSGFCNRKGEVSTNPVEIEHAFCQ
jgi:hypothetical protein